MNLIGLVVLFFSISTHAVLPIRTPYPKDGNFKALQKVTWFSGTKRFSFEEWGTKRCSDELKKECSSADAKPFVEQVKKEFSATGKFDCGGGVGTAQLVGKQNVITTSAHSLFDRNCKLHPLRDCFFEPLGEPGAKYFIKPPKRSQFGDCDLTPDLKSDPDWAVLKLKKVVKSANPYLPPQQPVELKPNDRLLLVAALASNYPGRVPYVTPCRVAYVNMPTYPDSSLMTDCGTGPGASGSAELKQIIVNGERRYEIQSMASQTTREAKDGGLYNVGDWNFNVSTIINGEFFKALRSVLDEVDSKEKSTLNQTKLE